MEPNKQNVVAAAIIAFVVGFAISYVIFGIDRGEEDVADNGNSEEQVEQTATANQAGSTIQGEEEVQTVSLSVPDQSAGGTVAVDAVTTPTPVWIAIHEGATPDATWVLGAQLVAGGTSENVSVNLLRGTSEDTTYFVKLHLDDGDREFELDEDAVLTDEGGGEIVASFNTAVSAE